MTPNSDGGVRAELTSSGSEEGWPWGGAPMDGRARGCGSPSPWQLPALRQLLPPPPLPLTPSAWHCCPWLQRARWDILGHGSPFRGSQWLWPRCVPQEGSTDLFLSLLPPSRVFPMWTPVDSRGPFGIERAEQASPGKVSEPIVTQAMVHPVPETARRWALQVGETRPRM